MPGWLELVASSGLRRGAEDACGGLGETNGSAKVQKLRKEGQRAKGKTYEHKRRVLSVGSLADHVAVVGVWSAWTSSLQHAAPWTRAQTLSACPEGSDLLPPRSCASLSFGVFESLVARIGLCRPVCP